MCVQKLTEDRPAMSFVIFMLESEGGVLPQPKQPGFFIERSFGDTLLPGMKWGRNMVTGLDRYLSSWKSSNDPAQGEFTFRIDPRGNSHNIEKKRSSDKKQVGIIAWRLWNEGRPLELINEPEQDSSTLSEIIRCIHVGLLCVQKRPEDRPNMSSVIVMLSSGISLPQPKQPGFFTERNLPELESSTSNQKSFCTNEITVSFLGPR
ncbi:hypothetical protein NC652_004199 [Populus alba x Populus x berolinensis]|nr:hypothetical protein NC652_004199 [Populus alba x Populus x berolinensis]